MRALGLQGEFGMYFRVFILSLLLSGCTSQLWQAPNYEEKITGFFGVKNEDLLIVTGQKFSYVFEANQNLKDTLILSRSIEFNPRYNGFKLDEHNNVVGTLSLISFKATQKKKLSSLGFIEDKYGNMEIKLQLKGKRYLVEGSFPFVELEDDHYLLVETPESGIATAGKIVATPATVAIDAMAAIPIGAMFAILGVMNKSGL
jgi:hypothetical protein